MSERQRVYIHEVEYHFYLLETRGYFTFRQKNLGSTIVIILQGDVYRDDKSAENQPFVVTPHIKM